MGALPKKKITSHRQGRRRRANPLEAQAVTLCPQCHQPKLSHQSCPECGFYKPSK